MTEQLSPGLRIRAFRQKAKLSLDGFADLIAASGVERPSAAKLSRIETEVQPVAFDLLDPLEKIVGIPAKELRPDLAKPFQSSSEETV